MTPLTEAEATRAVYVDFESLGNGLAAPAILGSLVVDGGDDFRQFVLSHLLRPAAVARKGVCINTSAEAAVLAVVKEAERHSRAIVSWSTHEAKVVRAVCSALLPTGSMHSIETRLTRRNRGSVQCIGRFHSN
jgi:hypothetical protein